MDRKKKIRGFLLFLFLGLAIWGVVRYEKETKSLVRVSPEGTAQLQVLTPASLVLEDLAALEQKSAFQEKLYLENVALPPPTNQWISSVVFRKNGEPLFAYPLAVKLDEQGFGLSLPKIVSTENTVFGTYEPQLRVTLGEGMEASLGTYDDLSAEVIQRSGGIQRSSLRLTRGSPFLFTRVAKGEQMRVSSASLRRTGQEQNFVIFEGAEQRFAVFFRPEEVKIEFSDEQTFALRALRNETLVTFAVLSKPGDETVFLPYAFDPIVKTRVEVTRTPEEFLTTYVLTTRTGNATLIALLPRHTETLRDAPPVLGTYATLRGEQRLYAGTRFTFGVPATVPPDRLRLDVLNETEKEVVRQAVREDLERLAFPETDTYFAGKKLYAAANLLDLAEQLGMEREAGIIQEKLKAELTGWKQRSFLQRQPNKYFSYDPVLRGIVGETPSFGSELFNDHNFHYGYFIYAASILARYDQDALAENTAFINLLVKDIMNDDREDNRFAYLRPFDLYEGHSWASGFGLFADGNNQESSSEAVNAWYAVYLWSRAITNPELEARALWLYNQEADSALRYWLNIDSQERRFVAYKHPYVSLVWGGKLDFATWFSPLPEATLGIQLIPLNAGSGYLATDRERIKRNLRAVPLERAAMFQDFLIMYEALADPAMALKRAAQVPTTALDSVNTMSYFKAWLFVQAREVGDPFRIRN